MTKKELKARLDAVQARLIPGFKGIVFAAGNRKLPKTHLIWNLTTAHGCPSLALGMCAVGENLCYACKCERVYPTYWAKNKAVEDFMKTATVDDILELLGAYIDYYGDITHIRINEAGDFVSQEMVSLVDEVAVRLYGERGIVTYGWSARKDLDFTGVHFLLNGSSDEVKGAIRVFKAVPKDVFNALPKGSMTCGGSRGGSCRTCHLCHQLKYRGVIYCRQH